MGKESVGYLVWHLSTQWRSAADRALAPLGLTHAQYVVLAELHGLSRSVAKPSQRQLADVSGLGKAYVSKLVRALEEAGLIRRTVDHADPRVIQLKLTTRGTRTAIRASAIAHELEDRLLSPLGGPESRHSTQLKSALLALLERND